MTPRTGPWSATCGRPSADQAARDSAFQNGAYETEWSFYHDLAPTLSIRHPEVYVARYDHATPDFVLLMAFSTAVDYGCARAMSGRLRASLIYCAAS